MTLVLRETVGRFSAGTRVTIEAEHIHDGGYLVVEATYTDVEWYTDWSNKRQQRRQSRTEKFEVRSDQLVELRNATDTVPATPRINRPERIARREVYKMKQAAE